MLRNFQFSIFLYLFRIMSTSPVYEFGKRSFRVFSTFTLNRNPICTWSKKFCLGLVSIRAKLLPFPCYTMVWNPFWRSILVILNNWIFNCSNLLCLSSRNKLKRHSVTKNCSDLSLFEQIVLVISKILQILSLQPRISKVFLDH